MHIYMYTWISCVYICIHACMCVHINVCSTHTLTHLSGTYSSLLVVCLSVCLSVQMSVCLSVPLSVSVYLSFCLVCQSLAQTNTNIATNYRRALLNKLTNSKAEQTRKDIGQYSLKQPWHVTRPTRPQTTITFTHQKTWLTLFSPVFLRVLQLCFAGVCLHVLLCAITTAHHHYHLNIPPLSQQTTPHRMR
jgi:hypothetical protein